MINILKQLLKNNPILAILGEWITRLRQASCSHERNCESWLVQQVRIRVCEDCGLVEEESPNHTFKKIVNGGNDIHRRKGEPCRGTQYTRKEENRYRK